MSEDLQYIGLRPDQWAKVRVMMIDGESYVEDRSNSHNPDLKLMADTIAAFDAARAEAERQANA